MEEAPVSGAHTQVTSSTAIGYIGVGDTADAFRQASRASTSTTQAASVPPIVTAVVQPTRLVGSSTPLYAFGGVAFNQTLESVAGVAAGQGKPSPVLGRPQTNVLEVLPPVQYEAVPVEEAVGEVVRKYRRTVKWL